MNNMVPRVLWGGGYGWGLSAGDWRQKTTSTTRGQKRRMGYGEVEGGRERERRERERVREREVGDKEGVKKQILD